MHGAQLHMQLLSLLRCGEWHELRVRRHISVYGFAVSIITHAGQPGSVGDIGALMCSEARALTSIEVLDTLGSLGQMHQAPCEAAR